jgi:outer membrane protein W
MTRGGFEGTALAVALAWLWSAGFNPAAQAQTPASAAPNATRDAVVDFDIPAQPMAAALNSWAVQANAQVFVDPGPVAHLLAPAVKGSLTPRQALRALLSRSNLQVAQGANGVYVIKPRPALVTAPAPATPAAPAPEGVAPLPSAPGPLTARAAEGAWLLALIGEYAHDSGRATGGATAALAGEYFITDQVVAALAVAAPRTHTFGGASARLQSSTLSLKYYFTPESRLRPYLGAGIDVTSLANAEGVTGLDRVTVGPAAEAGLDVSVSAHWMLNAVVGWAQIRPAAAGSPGRVIHLDPVQFGLGVVYRFGR